MKLIKEKTSIDFLSPGRRRVALAISAILIVVSISSLATRGLNFGIDFTGGVLLEVGYPQEADLEKIRTIMEDAGFEDAQVQRFGAATDVLLRLPPQGEGVNPNEIRDSLRNALATDEPNVVSSNSPDNPPCVRLIFCWALTVPSCARKTIQSAPLP